MDDRASYEHPIGSAMGSSLLAVGLYAATFESVIRLIRVAVVEFSENHDVDEKHISQLRTGSAASVIKSCRRYLVQTATATEDDINFLDGARSYRNRLVHEAIERAFVGPSIADVLPEINRMIEIAHSIEEWQRAFWPAPPEGTVRCAIMYSGLLQSCVRVARELNESFFDTQ